MKKIILLTLLGLCSAPLVHAKDFSYSHISVHFIQSELDDGTEGSGQEFELSYDFNRLVFSLNILLLDYSVPGDSVYRDRHMGGIGTYLPLTESVDLFGGIQLGVYNSGSTTSGPKLAERDIVIYKIGTRFAFDEMVEGMLYLGRYDYSENQLAPGTPSTVENMVGFRASLFSSVSSNLGFNAGVEMYESFTYTKLGITYQF